MVFCQSFTQIMLRPLLLSPTDYMRILVPLPQIGSSLCQEQMLSFETCGNMEVPSGPKFSCSLCETATKVWALLKWKTDRRPSLAANLRMAKIQSLKDRESVNSKWMALIIAQVKNKIYNFSMAYLYKRVVQHSLNQLWRMEVQV